MSLGIDIQSIPRRVVLWRHVVEIEMQCILHRTVVLLPSCSTNPAGNLKTLAHTLLPLFHPHSPSPRNLNLSPLIVVSIRAQPRSTSKSATSRPCGRTAAFGKFSVHFGATCAIVWSVLCEIALELDLW